MPNWCSNVVTINTGGSPELNERLKNALSDDKDLFMQFVPRPKEYDEGERWYGWNIDNWGTKWDVNEVFVADDTEEDSITFSFDTAWAPPVDAFRSWAERDGRVTYRLTYMEPGMGFVGWDSYDGESFDDDYAEQGEDPDRYWEMAAEEFGYEREEEEPEPLTEWYEQGVVEKGLK